jgi:hypothetical protein
MESIQATLAQGSPIKTTCTQRASKISLQELLQGALMAADSTAAITYMAQHHSYSTKSKPQQLTDT